MTETRPRVKDPQKLHLLSMGKGNFICMQIPRQVESERATKCFHLSPGFFSVEYAASPDFGSHNDVLQRGQLRGNEKLLRDHANSGSQRFFGVFESDGFAIEVDILPS